MKRLAPAAFAVFLSIAMTALLAAQSPPAQDGEVILRSETRVVAIDVSVRDARNKPVDDLKQNDFTITDDRKPRPFTIFAVSRTAAADAAAVPASSITLPPNTFTNVGPAARPADGHSTIVLLDSVNGWFDNFAMARAGVIGMLSRLPADERLALYAITKYHGLVILQDYTADRARLRAALQKYIPEAACPAPPYGEAGDEGMHDPPAPRGRRTIVTAASCRDPGAMQGSADTVRISLQALADGLKNQPGRKSVFWVTQGFPPYLLRGDASWDRTIAALNDANVAVNTLDSNGLGGPRRYWGPGGTLTMLQLAERTGGRAYYHRNDLNAALTEGIAEARTGYTLGFYLTELDGRYHALKVTVDRPGLQLTYRQGYYATDDSEPRKSGTNADLSTALLSAADSAAVGITASVALQPGGAQGTLGLRLHLSPESLSLRPGETAATGEVKEMYLELNAAGRVLGRQESRSRFDVDARKHELFETRGVTIAHILALPPGTATLSIVVQDTQSGRTGSLSIPLDRTVPAKTPPPAASR